ncbi:MAG: DUF1552 domain-containing protein [Acidobacteria bacterium]|nr:DUF1552 domain-containing protein [Acidobacteriota bacterium]
MMIFKKAIPRRAFLRGMGATLALPLLDGMVPAFAGTVDTASKPAVRLQYIYVPNGIMMNETVNVWTPSALGTNFDLPPALAELAAFRDQFVVVSGLDGGPTIEGMGGGHSRASAMWLTGVDPNRSEYDLRVGVSADQAAAKVLGKQTQLASIELGIENSAELVGTVCGSGATYTTTLAWRTPTTPLPVEHRPRAVFERLFGDGDSTDAKARLERIQEDRSILDFVNQQAARLMKGLGASDSSKLSQYLDAIRDVERRIQMAEQGNTQELPAMERPVGIPPYGDHVKLMFDLQVLAYQTDMTRVITFVMAREKSDLVYTQLGQTEPHHNLSHNRGIVKAMEQTAEINIYHAKLFSYFLERLRSTPDGDGSLLDHSMIVYGSGMGDGDLHTQQRMPILVAGGAAGQIKGGRHIKYPNGTPYTNLHLALLELAGAPTEKLGNSTGKLDLNAPA